jgi:hypothetical protein
MIGRWPSYSWAVVVPSGVTISVTANGVTEPLTLTAGTYRGLGASATLMGALATALATHTEIGATTAAYDWTGVVAQAVIECTSTVGPVVINSATGLDLTRLGIVAGASFGSALTTTQFVRAECWDGLWTVNGSIDVDFGRGWQAARTTSRYNQRARTQIVLSKTNTVIDRHLLVPGRYIDPEYAGMEAYSLNAQTQQGLTHGTLTALVDAQLAGQRDIGPGITTVPWLWRHTSASDLGGTSIDLVLPSDAFGSTALATRAGNSGRRYNVSITWQTTP